MSWWPWSRRDGARASGATPHDADFTPTAHDLVMMARAMELARQAGRDGEVPVGAVVYETDSGTIVGEGMNTRQGDRDPAGHAEFIAIMRASRQLGDWRLSGCSLAVTLEPCVMCAGLIVNARVGRVLYGAVDPKAGACVSLYRVLADDRLNHRPLVTGGPEGVGEELAQASGDLLRSFFRELRRADRDTKIQNQGVDGQQQPNPDEATG